MGINVYLLMMNVMDRVFMVLYVVMGWDATAGVDATTTCARTYETGGFVLSMS